METHLNDELVNNLKEFFENNPLSIEAASPLKKDAEIELVIDGEPWGFKRDGAKNSFTLGSPTHPDVVFTLNEASANKIVNSGCESIADFGVLILKMVVSKDADEKIRVASRVGPLKLMKKGYLGIIAKGGGAVAKFLADNGMGSFAKVKGFVGSIMRKS
jgi:hypothetical protein